MNAPTSKGKLYFAHPTNTYGTPFERAVELFIGSHLPQYSIESPNQPHHQKAYEKWQKETAQNRDIHSAMQYFFKVVQPMCAGSIALPFLDGKMGLGVAGEVIRDADDEKPTWFVEPTKADITAADLDAFIQDPDPENGLFVIRSFTSDELDLIRHEVVKQQDCIKAKILEGYDAAVHVLSHQETRLRGFYVYGKEIRPYAEAHLVSMPVPEGFYSDDK